MKTHLTNIDREQITRIDARVLRENLQTQEFEDSVKQCAVNLVEALKAFYRAFKGSGSMKA